MLLISLRSINASLESDLKMKTETLQDHIYTMRWEAGTSLFPLHLRPMSPPSDAAHTSGLMVAGYLRWRRIDDLFPCVWLQAVRCNS
jgi:hypothetical protein